VQVGDGLAHPLVRGEHLVVEVTQDEEERDEDRDLEQDRQAGRGRVDPVLLVELHQLFVPLLLVVLVARLQRLHLRHVGLHRLHRVDLPDGEREQHHAHEERQRDDRPRPGQPARVVEPLEQGCQRSLDRLEQEERSHHRKSLWPFT
jgi:hypothetical protein